MITIDEKQDSVSDSSIFVASPGSLYELVRQHVRRTHDTAKAKIDVLKFFMYLQHWIYFGKAILMNQDDSYYAVVRVDDMEIPSPNRRKTNRHAMEYLKKLVIIK